jgi:signal transduction histidine kinase
MARFVYHDLRHPLTAILAYSEFLARDNLDRSAREDFHWEIRMAVSRMNDLISSLLEFSKGSEVRCPPLAHVVSTVERAIRIVTVRPEFRWIAVHYEHAGVTEGRFDSGGLQQVITNIVLNACEAISPAPGYVQVRSLGRRDCLEISISDDGPGIPEPIRSSVFQAFVSHDKDGDTGLGLAIAQKILRDHGGDISLDATGEKGTVFRLVLPFHRPETESSTPSDAHGRMTLAEKACALPRSHRPITARKIQETEACRPCIGSHLTNTNQGKGDNKNVESHEMADRRFDPRWRDLRVGASELT